MTPAASPDEKFQGIVEGIRAHLVEEYGRDETGRPNVDARTRAERPIVDRHPTLIVHGPGLAPTRIAVDRLPQPSSSRQTKTFGGSGVRPARSG